MKRKLRLISILLALCLVLSLMGACGGKGKSSNDSASEPDTSNVDTNVDDPAKKVESTSDTIYERKTAEGTLTIGTTQPAVQQLDPANVSSVPGILLEYNTLVSIDRETGEILPELATEWKYEDDTTLYMKIRDNVYFHNGEHLTAEDVFFTLQRIINSGSRTASSFDVYDWDKCEIINDYEFRLVTKKPTGNALNFLATFYASILCKSYVESTGDEAFWDKPNGTGPFKLVENISGDRQIFTINENYWGELPSFTQVTICQYSEPTTMMIDYENGVLDVIYEMSESDAKRIMNGEVDHTNLEIVPQVREYILCMYDLHPDLSKYEVRKAIAHAIDIQAVADMSFGILSKPATSHLATGVKYRIETPGWEYDPELSRQLLKEAGYNDGDITLKLITVSAGNYPKIVEAIQAMLADVGINCIVETYDQPTAIAMMRGINNNGVPECDMGIYDMSITALDPDQSFNTTKQGGGFALAECHDDELYAALVEGQFSVDDETRAKAYEKVQTLLYENVYQIPLFEGYSAVAYRDYIASCDTGDPIHPDLTKVVFK
ncbi:MAG: ABC transporter substrate-binding protein [Oscillospiraceae bacterium]|jgi:peptide/nickel transport system substrate-binding protein